MGHKNIVQKSDVNALRKFKTLNIR